MSNDPVPATGHVITSRQRARASLMVTPAAGLTAEVELTSRGILSIAVLVSSILLSTAVLVRAAKQRSPD